MHRLSPVRCTLLDGAIFDVIASDINPTGLYFYMSDSPAPLSVGDSLRFSFDTPGLEGVKASATIQDSSEILDMLCFRARFQEISEGGQPRLMEYQRGEEGHPGQETEEGGVSGKGVIFVVDEPHDRDRYGFLDQNFNVIHSDSFDVIGKLLAASPDAILFNSCLPDTEMILQILTNHPILKRRPLIEVQVGKPKNAANFFASLPFPWDESRVLETLYQAIEAEKISRILSEGEYSGPFRMGISILLVDDSSNSEEYDLEVLRGLDCDVKRIADLKLLYDSFVWSTPDVIAIDENTREVDARTVCRLLNMNRELKDVPKLLLSKKKGRGDSDRSGLFSSVLTKPFTTKQLLSKAHYLLAQVSH